MRVGSAAVARIDEAHVPPTPQGGAKRKRWQPHSVSSVLHLDSHLLVSAGASDGTVKLWDCRTLSSTVSAASPTARAKAARKPMPSQQLQPSLSRGNRLHGVARRAAIRARACAVSHTARAAPRHGPRATPPRCRASAV
eukprot:2168752-Prymnesium_polylepis.2